MQNIRCPQTSNERDLLLGKYATKLVLNPDFTRSLVSFQANKNVPFYRWLKYKEGFSSELVRHLLSRFRPDKKTTPSVLDPFAGAGTTLTTAAKHGWRAVGIEILPVGAAAMRARISADVVDLACFQHEMQRLAKYDLSGLGADAFRFPHIRITEKAFSEETECAIAHYRSFVNQIEDYDTRYLFWFACLAVLEDTSYTRKDGQYLRWDSRSGRSLKSKFDKGNMPEFKSAIHTKLATMWQDLEKRNGGTFSESARVIEGSCLAELPTLADDEFDLVITSPPYCNRYDYTRTYALELAFMGYDDAGVRDMRQAMLSCTVENRSKRFELAHGYHLRGSERLYTRAEQAFEQQQALHEVLGLLHEARRNGQLNNNNIPTMVENYFFEMNLVIHELARVLTPGGHIVMVNDNVQYNGEEVPVDLILGDFAESAGLTVDCIWVLPRGKGNSSQQMGCHGRKEIRKCVYVWSKSSNTN